MWSFKSNVKKNDEESIFNDFLKLCVFGETFLVPVFYAKV